LFSSLVTCFQEYEGYDDYEDEELEEGEGYEEEEGQEYVVEEPRKPTKEELEYLELRQKLKESIRNKMKKENSTSLANSGARKKQIRQDK
jgi:protein SPT2